MARLTPLELQTLQEDFISGRTIRAYRTMQLIDGELYPPMAARQDLGSGKREYVAPTSLGSWQKSDENLSAATIRTDGSYAYYLLDKGNDPETGAALGTMEVAYNPYFHTSQSPLNDQFSSAYKRPNLVTVEVEIPISELTSGYRANMAKDSVGEVDWHMGPVSSKLAALGDKRSVILSRYCMPLRIVPDREVAELIADKLEGKNIKVPYNVITPSLRTELERLNVHISDVEELDKDRAEDYARECITLAQKAHMVASQNIREQQALEKQLIELEQFLAQNKNNIAVRKEIEIKRREEHKQVQKALKAILAAQEAEKKAKAAKERAAECRRKFIAYAVSRLNKRISDMERQNKDIRSIPSFEKSLLLHTSILGSIVVFGQDIERMIKNNSNFISVQPSSENNNTPYAFNIQNSIDEVLNQLEVTGEIRRGREGNFEGIVNLPDYTTESTVEQSVSIHR